jgi:hypothetical protein
MDRTKLIANRLNEVLLNGEWIANTNIKKQIEGLTWQQANLKIGNHNSIAELTFHINYYLGGVLNVLMGGDLEIQDKYSFDMEPITSEKDWQNLVLNYISNANKFIGKVEFLDDEILEKPFVKKEYGSYERNIEGLIEHSYYHLGQISLIKKLVLS